MAKSDSAPSRAETKRKPRINLQLRGAEKVARQQTQLMHVRAADAIRSMIIEGKILPGSRMPEMELCELLGISRTPLREALKVLSSEGLLNLTPQHGAMVTKPNVEELDATVEAVAYLEAAAARISCSKAGDLELVAIANFHEQMKVAAAAQDFRRYFKANQSFHAAIVKASQNVVLIDLHTRANAHLMRHRYQTIDKISPDLRKSFIKQHEKIVKALLARDSVAVDRAVLAHLRLIGDEARVTSDNLTFDAAKKPVKKN